MHISVKAIPELAAYPHPIGYDVVNYYIPKVVNFQEQWDTISRQFPFYLTFLYSLSASVELSPQAVVTSVAVAMAGIFGVSLFYIGRTLLSLQIIQSLFLATFTVLRMVVLRTFWDPQRRHGTGSHAICLLPSWQKRHRLEGASNNAGVDCNHCSSRKNDRSTVVCLARCLFDYD